MPRKNKIDIDYALLRQLASEGKPVAVMADEMGIVVGTFYNRMKSDPAFKAAVCEGRNGSSSTSDEPDAPAEIIPETPKMDLIESIVRSMDRGNHLWRQIGEDLNISFMQFITACDDAIDRGLVEAVVTPSFNAYFRKGQVPAGRLALDGNGGVMVVQAETAEPYTPAEREIENVDDPEPMTATIALDVPKLDETVAPAEHSAKCLTCDREYSFTLYDGSPSFCSDKCRDSNAVFEVRRLDPDENRLTVALPSGGEVTVSVRANLFTITDGEFEFLSGLRQLIAGFRGSSDGFLPQKN